jgi:hypothetical protein
MASRLQYAPRNVDPRQIQHERACDTKWGHSDSIFDLCTVFVAVSTCLRIPGPILRPCGEGRRAFHGLVLYSMSFAQACAFIMLLR